jgi:hypothetical protein
LDSRIARQADVAGDAAKYPATEAVVRQKLAPTWEGTVLQSDGV